MSYFSTPSPFSSWSQSDVCLCAYPWRTVPTSQMYPVIWSHPLIEYDQKTLLFTQFMREGIQIKVVKLWKSACQPNSSRKECLKNQCLLHLNLPHLYNKKGTQSPFIVTLIFCLYPPTFKCQRLSFHQNLVKWRYQNQFYWILHRWASSRRRELN